MKRITCILLAALAVLTACNIDDNGNTVPETTTEIYETTPAPETSETVLPDDVLPGDVDVTFSLDKEVYGYGEEVGLIVENTGKAKIQLLDVTLSGIGMYNNIEPKQIFLSAGEKHTEKFLPENFSSWSILTSGDYSLYVDITAGKGLNQRFELPIKFDLGKAESLKVSHPRGDVQLGVVSDYCKEDITFTLTNQSNEKLTITDESFAIDVFDYDAGSYSEKARIPYNGKKTLEAGEEATVVLPYELAPVVDDGLPCGRIAVNYTLENGNSYKAYSLFGYQPEGGWTIAKPVIYLYPEEKTDVSVQIDFDGKLTCTYPDYGDGWNVTAYPDGRIINHADGLEYSYLFWEGDSDVEWDMSEGYVVKGADTAKFLRKILSEMGLTPREYNEFIVYWLPKMQNNKYNLITFQQEVYENSAKLKINPTPDSLLRIFMVYKPLDEQIEITAPEIEKFERKGFTVVEWGGTEAK